MAVDDASRWVYATGWDFEDPTPELYDLAADPEELRNVHADQPDVVGEMRARVEALLGTPIPQPYSQDRFDATDGYHHRPLYSSSYAPVFYSARRRLDNPRALPG